jgi:hypothetical protein
MNRKGKWTNSDGTNGEVEMEEKERQTEKYYQATTGTVLVPVKVRYHYATDTIYSFDAPTTDEVEEALKDNKQRQMEQMTAALNYLLDFVVSGRRYNVIDPYLLNEVEIGYAALGLNCFGKKE